MELVHQLQQQFLEDCRARAWGVPFNAAVERAYLEIPRHRFIKRYRKPGSQEWIEMTPENLQQNLPILYRDSSLALLEDEKGVIYSSISQPSLVLQMLNLLQLQPGHQVFELGAGSGWNAALMGYLVAPAGHVYSVEILPEIAQMATEAVAALALTNVSIIQADGADAYAKGAPYDRAIFTAGTYDLPRAFYQQLKESALLLAVIKHPGDGDSLFLLQKVEDHFDSLTSLPCGFVPVTGKSQISNLEPITLKSVPDWESLSQQEIASRPFWWGDRSSSFAWKTRGIRSFLGIVEPLFQVFVSDSQAGQPQELFFGLLDRANSSLVVVRGDRLISYGNQSAQTQLLHRIHEWIDLGMPEAASFKLSAYPIDVPITAQPHHWIVQRKDSQFVWSLN
jgi:protein-L-isoaspartate(D-aspartate) O-methyltransferase